ncbi:MAG: DnaA/Hda family protein [Pseudomonadota bacterium]
MSAQLPLPFELRDEFTLETFVAGPNGAVVDALQTLAGGVFVWLAAPSGRGKSHLLQALCGASKRRLVYVPASAVPAASAAASLDGLSAFDAVLIDDVDRWHGTPAAEAALIGLYQSLRAGDTPLVCSAVAPAAGAVTATADWGSRVRGAQALTLSELSEDDRVHVLRQRAARLGLDLGEEVVAYLLRRLGRGLPELLAVLARLDRAALAEQRRLTVPFVRKALRL